jgi:multidrug resistance efflux pump
MARKRLTDRQLLLQEAQATLKAERAVLKQQQARVAAARRAVDRLSCCDWCGARTMATGLDLQLCFACQRDRAELNRRQLLAQHGYGPDGERIAAA